MTAAAYGGRERISADLLLRREGHPLGVRRVYEDPADEAPADGGAGRRWTFGVAAGALLVAGTVAAGTLGMNGDVLPTSAEGAPEHAPTAPGNAPHDGGAPAAAGDQSDHGDDADRSGQHRPAQPAEPSAGHPRVIVPVEHSPQAGTADTGGHATGESLSGEGEPIAPAPTPEPAPAPAPAPEPAPAPGLVEQVVTPVTDTVSDVVTPVTDTVGDLLSPVTGILGGGGGDQPALTMIDPLGGLLGG